MASEKKKKKKNIFYTFHRPWNSWDKGTKLQPATSAAITATGRSTRSTRSPTRRWPRCCGPKERSKSADKRWEESNLLKKHKKYII